MDSGSALADAEAQLGGLIEEATSALIHLNHSRLEELVELAHAVSTLRCLHGDEERLKLATLLKPKLRGLSALLSETRANLDILCRAERGASSGGQESAGLSLFESLNLYEDKTPVSRQWSLRSS